VPFEILNFSLVLFRRLTRGEGSQISALAGLGVLLSRVQTVITGFEFPDHLLTLLRDFQRLTGCALAFRL
jgi:hypothetical protein